MRRTPQILFVILSSSLIPAVSAAPATQPQTRAATRPSATAPAASVAASTLPSPSNAAKPLPEVPAALAGVHKDLTATDPAVRIKACQDLSSAEKFDPARMALLPLLARMSSTDSELAVQDAARQPFRSFCEKSADEATKQAEVLTESQPHYMFVLQDPLVVLELKQTLLASLQRVTTGETKAKAANALLPDLMKLAADPLVGDTAMTLALQLAADASDENQAKLAEWLVPEQVRARALKQMTTTRPPVRTIIRALSAPESRLAALSLLGTQPNKDFIEPLLPLLGEKDGEIRSAAMEALLACIQSHEKPDQLATSLPQLAQVLGKAAKDSDFYVRINAAQLARTLKPAPKPNDRNKTAPPVEPPLEQPKAEEILSALRDPRQSARGVAAALTASGAIANPKNLAGALQMAAVHKNPAARLAAVTALQRLGVANESAAQGIAKLLRAESDAPVRAVYVSMLSSWEHTQDQSLGKPIENISIKSAKAAEALMRFTRSVADDRRKVFEYSNNPTLPLTEVAPLIKVFIVALSDRVSDIRIAAADSLAKNAEQAKAAVPMLLKETATHWNDDCRAAGLKALLAIDPENPDVAAILRKAADDPAQPVRRIALKAAVLAGDKPAVSRLIGGAWSDELDPAAAASASHREMLTDLLKTLKPSQLASFDEMPENLLQSLRDPHPTRRIQAMNFVAQQLGPLGRGAVPQLLESLESIEPEVVQQAVVTIRTLGQPPAAAVTAIAKRACRGPSRTNLLGALGEFGAAGKAALPVLQEAAEKTKDTNFKSEIQRAIDTIENPPQPATPQPQ